MGALSTLSYQIQESQTSKSPDFKLSPWLTRAEQKVTFNQKNHGGYHRHVGKRRWDGKQQRQRVMEQEVWPHQVASGVTAGQNGFKDTGITVSFPHHIEMSPANTMTWARVDGRRKQNMSFGEADGRGAARAPWFYLHHHLLPSQRLAVRCVGRPVGPLQLQRDIAPLLLEGSGQLLEARLLFFHRGQDAGGRANVIVLHGRGRLQRCGSSNTGSEGGKKGGGGGGGMGSLETPWPGRMGVNRLTRQNLRSLKWEVIFQRAQDGTATIKTAEVQHNKWNTQDESGARLAWKGVKANSTPK